MKNKYSKNDIDKINFKINKKISTLRDDEVISFTDGSYNKEARQSGFGIITIYKENNSTQEIYMNGTFFEKRHRQIVALKNVGAEIEAVKVAIKWAVDHCKSSITIYYDYEGIEKWANMTWRHNNDITHDYVSFILENSNLIKINFQKIPAHSGVILNEKVDKLAKKSANKKNKK